VRRRKCGPFAILKIVDVPVRSPSQLLLVGDPAAQASRPQGAPKINVVPGLLPNGVVGFYSS
jgi:hypothetical protein